MLEYGTTSTARNEGVASQSQEELTALVSNIAAQAAKAAVESIGVTQSGYQAALSGQPLTETQAQQAQQAQSRQAGRVQAQQQAGQQAQPAQTQQAEQLQPQQQTSQAQSQQASPSFSQQATSPQLSAFEQQQARTLSQQQYSPAVDVIERPNEVLILADLPGVDSDSIDVRANDSTISLSAERISRDEEDQKGAAVMYERGNVMQRQIQLPAECNVDDASASWDNGVVEITLPKTESESQKQIGVQ